VKKYEIDGLAALTAEIGDGLEDFAMGVEIEALGVDDLHHLVDDIVVAQHAAEHGALGIEVLRGQTFWRDSIRRHRLYLLARIGWRAGSVSDRRRAGSVSDRREAPVADAPGSPTN